VRYKDLHNAAIRLCCPHVPKAFDMDDFEIRLLALSDRAEAMAAARLHGLDDLALEIELLPDLVEDEVEHVKAEVVLPDSLFQIIALASFNVAEVGRAAQIPRSTAAAAALGRCAGGTTHHERNRIAKLMRHKRDLIDKILERCERKAKL